MEDYINAAIDILFVGTSLGVMVLAMIWSFLRIFSANEAIIVTGEVLGFAAMLCLAVPMYKFFLQNERACRTEQESNGSLKP